MAKPSTLGGSRPGAGRPATRGETKKPLTIKITPTLREFLDEQKPKSAANYVEDALRRLAAFKDWFKQRGMK